MSSLFHTHVRYDDVQHKKVEGREICRRRNYCLNWWASWWWDTRRCLDGIVIGSDPWGHQRSQKKVEEEKISTPAPPIYSLKKKTIKNQKVAVTFFDVWERWWIRLFRLRQNFLISPKASKNNFTKIFFFKGNRALQIVVKNVSQFRR